MTPHEERARAVVDGCQVPASPNEDEVTKTERWHDQLIIDIATALQDAERRVWETVLIQLDMAFDEYFAAGNTQARLAIEALDTWAAQAAQKETGT